MKPFLALVPWLFIALFVWQESRGWVEDAKPASDYFVVRSVAAHDSVVGNPILLTVNREVKQRFTGTWVVSIRKLLDDGEQSACSATNTTIYLPKTMLPDPLDLDWWTHPVACRLSPGQYQMTTEWRIAPEHGAVKRVVAVSNVFRVLPKE